VAYLNRAVGSIRRQLAVVSFAAAFLFLVFSGTERPPGIANAATSSRAFTGPPDDMCSWPVDPNPSADTDATLPSVVGGDLDPVRYVMDPYPTFNGIALDVANNRVILSDENRKSVITYDRKSGSTSKDVTSPLLHIIGPHTEIGYISGIEVDPPRRELYAVNNDIEDRVVVFDYDSNGDLKPKRHLYTPHQAWGLSLNPSQDEMVISVQQLSLLAVYRREAFGLEAPLRIIQGPHTNMADPHGVRWDTTDHEIVVASHGNSAVISPYTAYDTGIPSSAMAVGGRFLSPSISTFDEAASGDAKPLRTIQGSNARLNWPMGVDVDAIHGEIAVANNGDNSVLIFGRTADGNVAPVRVIRGARTGIVSPMGVAIDPKNNELWVANYGDHTALVFAREATGDVAPKRIIRNAPAGTPTGGFGNPYAVAYDSKRDQLLVPN
jgi:DNA-binding beta-propeller fold protein YncE